MIGKRVMKLNLPYLMRVRQRTGGWRYYVRRKGQLVRLLGQPGETGFHEAYQVAVGGVQRELATTARARTWRWLCEAYMASPEWAELSRATKRQRELVLSHTWAEPLVPGGPDLMGDCPLQAFGPKHIRVLRDRKRDHPDAANHRIKAVSAVFRWAIEAQHATSNPARDVPNLRPLNREGHHTWTSAEVEQYRQRHSIGTKPRLALELLLFTGARRSDVVRLGRPMARDGWLNWTAAKTGKQINIPILAQLQAAIDATPLTGVTTWLVTQYGRQFTVAGFGNWFRGQCNAAGLAHCSAHGLRKAGATIAADNGATPHELMAIFGWSTLKEAMRYTRQVDRRRLAADAMRLLVSKEG